MKVSLDRRTAVTLLMIASLSISLAAKSDETVLFTRADAIEVVTGQVEWRRAYTARLELPQGDCRGEPWPCTEDRIYSQIYSLEFQEERLHRNTDGSNSIEQNDRGRLLLALDLSPEHEEMLEVSLLAHLAELNVASYALPRAGMGFLRDPLSLEVFEQSALPAWVCKELDGEYGFELAVAEDGQLRSTRSGSGDLAKDACRVIQRATEGLQPETLRTAPSVRVQRRQTVRLQSISTLDGLTWSDDLAAIPSEASFVKSPLNGNRTGSVRDRKNGAYGGHEGRYHGVEREVRLPQASLQLLEAPMWISRWVFDSVHEVFGRRPERTDEAPVSIVMAVVPIADPSMDDLTRTRTALFVPERALVEAALERMEKSATLDPAVVKNVFRESELWPAQGDWMVVSCLDDGTSRYGIAPFTAAARVTNAQATCAAILREIGE